MSTVAANGSSSLRHRSLRALLWSTIDTCGRQGVQFGTSVILARLLAPVEFGLLGMTALFLAIAGAFVDSGFSAALIQRKEITEADKTSVFYFNIAAGLTMAGLIFVAAPWIAAFYDEPLLVGLTRLLALNLLIGAFGAVQFALLNRHLDFKTPWKIGMAATTASGVVAVWMAWKGYGVWSLAVQANVSTLISTLLVWALVPWRPGRAASMASLRTLAGYGSRLLASGLLYTVFEGLQLLLIGKFYSAASLGFYARAHLTQQTPTNLMSSILAKVTFPVFSTISEDREKLREAVRKSIQSVMVLNMPMMVGLAVLAKPFVLVVFGEKWLPCVPYLQLLSFVGVFWPLHVINLNLLRAMGRSDLFFRLEVMKAIVTGLALLITCKISVMAIAWGVLLSSIAGLMLNTLYSKGLIRYGLLSQLRDLAPYGGVSASMGVLGWFVSNAFSSQPAAQLALAVLSGAAFYCTICYALRLEAFRFVLELVFSQFPWGRRSAIQSC